MATTSQQVGPAGLIPCVWMLGPQHPPLGWGWLCRIPRVSGGAHWQYLQLPDAPAVSGNAVDSLAHEGNEHVEQQDIGEEDVGQQQQQHHPTKAQLFLESQLTHTNGELEQL